MTGGNPTTPPHGAAETTNIRFAPNQWYTLVQHINRQVDKLIEVLDGRNNIPYIQEWKETHTKIVELVNTTPTATYYDSNRYLFANPLTMYDYCTELINMVPPLRAIITVEKLRPNREDNIQVTLRIHNATTAAEQRAIHNTWTNPSPDKTVKSIDHFENDVLETSDLDKDDSVGAEDLLRFSSSPSSTSMARIAPTLKDQVDNMQLTIDGLVADLSMNIRTQLDEAIKNAVQEIATKAQENLMTADTTLKESIQQGQTTAAKLTGDIRNADKAIEDLRAHANNLTARSQQAQETTAREYGRARHELQQLHADAMAELETARRQHPTHTPTPMTPRTKHDDEYKIKGLMVQIRGKKYQDDKTPITCPSKDHLLLMYDHLANISRQYGIYITDLGDLKKWDKPNKDHPPTFPYGPDAFESREQFQAAYTSMTLSLATKLKTGIKFGRNYHAARLIVHDHALDGYEILYHLIATIHPVLLHNRAMRPSKPQFQGDLHQFIASYRNWLEFNRQRQPPHEYDDDEIADDVIRSIKTSRWANKLKDGLNRVEQMLERWKNDIQGSHTFPLELRMEFITNTILQYYVERNIDPLATQEQRPIARALHTGYRRGRSNERRQSRERDTSRNRSYSSNRTRSHSATPLRDCEICGGRHRTDTIGCPHLIRHQHITDFINQHGEREVRHLVDDAESHRSRSASRESQYSRRTRDTSQDRRT